MSAVCESYVDRLFESLLSGKASETGGAGRLDEKSLEHIRLRCEEMMDSDVELPSEIAKAVQEIVLAVIYETQPIA